MIFLHLFFGFIGNSVKPKNFLSKIVTHYLNERGVKIWTEILIKL